MSADRVTYIGHATTLVELGGARILTDPVLRDRVLHIRRYGPSPGPESWQRIDAVVVSHLHPDHLDYRSLRRRVAREVPVVVSKGAGALLRRRRVANPIEVAVGDAVEIAGVTIVATRAVHDGRRYRFGRRVDALGYELHGGGRGIYFAGDTGPFDEMAEMNGRIDLALLPIAGWGATVKGRHLNPRTAAEAAALIGPRFAVPIHWGSLLRADLRWRRPELLTEPGREFAARLAELAPGVQPAVLAPGDAMSLDWSPARSA
jgi:L-ascorbate metabolism protein UlaG (beta-lactamase superfamily)